MPVEIGRRFGRYEVQSRLGGGGMGEVYLARDTQLGRPVALKLLPGDIESKHGLKRFEQEAFAASALNHPNILTVYEIVSDGGDYCIAAEFVDGQTLRQRIAGGRLPVSDALDVAEQVARALAAAHESGIVHRDIKPENIMVRRDGLIKVVDFGLAKLTNAFLASGRDVPTASVFQTQAGLILGTVGYMSPEQIRGQTVDGRSDLWSLGVVFYEMLAGRHPFSGPTISDTIAAALEREPPATGAPGHVPAEAERIVRKALAKDRDARYQSAKDLAIDLTTLARRRTIEAEDRERDDGAGTRRAAMLRYGLAVAAAVAVLGSLPFVLTVGPETASIPSPERTVEYAVVVDPLRNGPYQAPFEAAPDQVLGSGSRFRLRLNASQAGFLYLLSDEAAEDGVPLLRMLSPSPSVNDGNAAYAAGQPIETGWYRLGERAGTETLWIVWSAQAVRELEEVKGVVNPDDLGVIAGADRTGRIREYLAMKSVAQPAEPSQPGSARRIVRAHGDVLVARLHLRHQ